MSNAPDITIGVMCYNEAGSIEKTLNGITAFLNLNAGLTAEILVVDDGSADNSVEITRKIQASESRIRLVEHVQNKGIGMTLQSIYTGATGNIITAVPGDGQFDIGELTPWIGLQAGNLVNLYRVENTTYGLFRNGLSLINKLLNRYIVGLKIKDVNWILIFTGRICKKRFLSN